MAEADPTILKQSTADIVSAHVAHNSVAASELAALIKGVHDALSSLGQPVAAVPAGKSEPAVSIRSSVKPDYIVCLEDGKKLTMLKRYIASRYNLTPAQYRQKWGLPHDYPMVAPNYADKRRTLAKAIGLGRKAVAKVADVVAPAPKPRGRPAKTAAPTPAPAPAAEAPKPKRVRKPKAA